LFSSPASEHRFLLRILPQSDDRQRIKSLSWHIDPSPADTLWQTVDGFGNDALAGLIKAPHGHFSFGIQGIAEVSDEPYTASGEPPRFLIYPTELTRAHSALVDFYNDINQFAPVNAQDRIQHFSHAVHSSLRYERGATGNSTSAAEAFDSGSGVCQDYTHILLAILRLDKIPCRDFADSSIERGIFKGACRGTQTVSLNMQIS